MMNVTCHTPRTPPRRKGASQDPSKPRPCLCGRSEGPDPSCEVIFWTPRRAPRGPPALGLSLGAGLAHTRTARAKTAAEWGEQALGAECWAAGAPPGHAAHGARARARAQMDLSSCCPGALWGEGLAETGSDSCLGSLVSHHHDTFHGLPGHSLKAGPLQLHCPFVLMILSAGVYSSLSQ